MGAGRAEGEGRGEVGETKWLLVNPEPGEAAELRRARESQGPAGYAGACPPLGPRSGATSASLLCPWTLAPALSGRRERRFIAKVCLRRPQPAPWPPPAGVRGRPEAAQAVLARRPLAAALRSLGVGRSGLAAAGCSRELAGLRELRGGVPGTFTLPRHTPPFSSALLGRVKKTKTGLSSLVRRLLAQGAVIRAAPEGQRRGRCSGTGSAGRGARGSTAGPFRESGGGRGSGDGRSPRRRATASRRPPLPGPLRAAGPGFVRRGRVRGGGSRRPQRLRCPRTAAAARALAAA